MSNQSGWYRNQDGDVFHIHGQDMSDETIEALGAMAAAARKMVEDDPDAFYAQKEREHHANLDAIEAEAEEQQWFEENEEGGLYDDHDHTCQACNGTGQDWDLTPCQECDGEGFYYWK